MDVERKIISPIQVTFKVGIFYTLLKSPRESPRRALGSQKQGSEAVTGVYAKNKDLLTIHDNIEREPRK